MRTVSLAIVAVVAACPMSSGAQAEEMLRRLSVHCECMIWIKPSTTYAECIANADRLGTSHQFCDKSTAHRRWVQHDPASSATGAASPMPAIGAQPLSARPTAKIR
jgi:hypothetical protein